MMYMYTSTYILVCNMHFLMSPLYSGSKSGPYRVVFDRPSGQYREIWTSLGCRGFASCMTTVTCHVISTCSNKIKDLYGINLRFDTSNLILGVVWFTFKLKLVLSRILGKAAMTTVVMRA